MVKVKVHHSLTDINGRYYPGEPFFQALARHEHFLAHHLQLQPGMRVLDVGCGVGGPAREIARFSDVKIVGLNNNLYQVDRAKKYTAKAGLSDQVEFVKGDFMKWVLFLYNPKETKY